MDTPQIRLSDVERQQAAAGRKKAHLPVDAEAIGQKSGRLTNEALLSAYAEQFNQTGQFLQALFGGSGGQVHPMTDADHFLHYLEFLNPSVPEQKISDPLEFFDSEKSIQENCWLGEGRRSIRAGRGS